jgi:hypothetical protein
MAEMLPQWSQTLRSDGKLFLYPSSRLTVSYTITKKVARSRIYRRSGVGADYALSDLSALIAFFLNFSFTGLITKMMTDIKLNNPMIYPGIKLIVIR